MAVLRYAEILADRGISWGLLGPKEGERIWERHIENSLPLSTLFREDESSLVDIGSGAGLPGIVLALARPNLNITLIEPIPRRAEFLRGVVDELALGSVRILQIKAEKCREQFDIATARAVAPLPKLKELAWPLLKPGGRLLAIKGESAAEELAASELTGVASSHLHEINLNDLPVARVIELVKAG